MMPVTLQTLTADVVLNILCYCGISGVLAVSQTCRQLNTLAFTKQVWLSLIRDARLLLDGWPESPLHHYTTAELIDLAKRMVQGPQTWSGSHPSRPVIACQEVIHPTIHNNPGHLFWNYEPILLSGGKHVLFNNDQVLECWNVAEDRLIWKHRSQWEFTSVVRFAAEVVDDSRAAVIIICLQQSVHEMERNFLEVVRLDFLTEISQSLFAPNTTFDRPFASLKICGDIALMGYGGTMNQVLVMNWKTQLSFILRTSRTLCSVTFLSTNLIIVEPGPEPDSCHMEICSVQSLARFWSPWNSTHHRDNMFLTSDIPRLVSATIQLPFSHRAVFIRLSAHKSPLREDLSVIWVHICSVAEGPSAPKFTVSKFSLIQTPATKPQLCLRSTTCMQGLIRPNHDISYAGYTETFRDLKRIHRVLAFSGPGDLTNDDGRIIHLPDKGVLVHVSAYSGALTYATRSSVVVEYYQ